MTKPRSIDPREDRVGAEKVARRLREAGYEAWFAGGCVRDLLLGQVPKDWDVATDAKPDEVQAVFSRTVAVGAAFGVIQVLVGPRQSYEVATFRADGDYEDGRRPTEVHYSKSRQEDVLRRDFTINALLMDPESEEILDYVGGREDLEAGLIKAVGHPQERFQEDRLRMLRAVRFAARLGFKIETDTWAALVAEADQLGVVSAERVTQELEGIFTCARPGLGVDLLERSGLAQAALVDARPSDLGLRLERLLALGSSLSKPDRVAGAWALVHDELSWTQAEASLKARRLSRAALRAVQDLFETRADLEAAARGVEAAVLRRARGPTAELRGAYLAARRGDGATLPQLFAEAGAFLADNPPCEDALLGGQDLKALGLSPGPHFKRLIALVEDAVLEGRVRSKDEAVALVRAEQL